jgi:hypothetical protein
MGITLGAAWREGGTLMLVKLSELLYKLYSDDQQNVIEALRVVRVLDAITVEQIAETIASAKTTPRPVFYNSTAKIDAIATDDQHLKLLATHIKQKTDLVTNLKLVSKVGDEELVTLAKFLRGEKEAVIVANRVAYTSIQNAKPFLPLVNWSQQRDLVVGESR